MTSSPPPPDPEPRAARRKPPGAVPTAPKPKRCDIATHTVMAGMQETRVDPYTAAMSVTGSPYISLRVGRCLLLIEDREALLSWVSALTRAELHSPKVFGSSDMAKLTSMQRKAS